MLVRFSLNAAASSKIVQDINMTSFEHNIFIISLKLQVFSP